MRGGRGGSSDGNSSSRITAVSMSASPTPTRSALADTSTSGGRLANNCSTGRPNPVREFEVMVFSSISHSGCSQPYARCSLPCAVTDQMMPSSGLGPVSAGIGTVNW